MVGEERGTEKEFRTGSRLHSAGPLTLTQGCSGRSIRKEPFSAGGTSYGHRGCALHNSRSYPFTVCTGSPLLTPWEQEHEYPRPASSSSTHGHGS